MALAHGIDIVEVARINDLLSGHPERFTTRCFTPAERAYCDANPARRAEHYAARFAAKEAALKALGTGWSGGLAWTDVEVTRNADGAPALALHNDAKRIARERGLEAWAVSLSHTGSLAVASVVATGAAGA